MTTKRCARCHEQKEIDAFPIWNGSKDGRREYCKPCWKSYLREWRDKNFARVRAKDIEYDKRPEVRAKIYARNAEWRKLNKLKTQAHWKLNHAINRGEIKPQPCWVCGEKAEAHHPDYSQPFDVVWLCKPHHKQAHALIQGNDHERK